MSDGRGGYRLEMKTDGSGEWSVTLPPDFDEHDLDALVPVVSEVRAFVAPTILPEAS